MFPKRLLPWVAPVLVFVPVVEPKSPPGWAGSGVLLLVDPKRLLPAGLLPKRLFPNADIVIEQ